MTSPYDPGGAWPLESETRESIDRHIEGIIDHDWSDEWEDLPEAPEIVPASRPSNFRCPTCDAVYDNQESLDNHMVRHGHS